MTEQHPDPIRMSLPADPAAAHRAVDGWLGSSDPDPYRTCTVCKRPRITGDGNDAIAHAQCDQAAQRVLDAAGITTPPAPDSDPFWRAAGAASHDPTAGAS